MLIIQYFGYDEDFHFSLQPKYLSDYVGRTVSGLAAIQSIFRILRKFLSEPFWQ